MREGVIQCVPGWFLAVCRHVSNWGLFHPRAFAPRTPEISAGTCSPPVCSLDPAPEAALDQAMAKLYFHYSTMNAGKSTLLLQAAHNYHECGMQTYLITARLDNRA